MSTTAETPVYEVGRGYDISPGDLRIGSNVRKDTRPDAKNFAASVRARGVGRPVGSPRAGPRQRAPPAAGRGW